MPPFPSSSGARASPLPLLFGFKMARIENTPPATALPPPTPHFIVPAYIKHPESTHSIPRSHFSTQIAPFATEKLLHRVSPHRTLPTAVSLATPSRWPMKPLMRFSTRPSSCRSHPVEPPWPEPPGSGSSDELTRRRESESTVDRWACVVHCVHRPGSWIFPTEKHILNSVILKVYTKVPQLSENSSLVPDSEFYLKK
jgi:hypothetical protein